MQEEKSLEQQFEDAVIEKGVSIDKLKEAGFTGITDTLTRLDKIQMAYEKYPSISQSTIDDYNKKLRKATEIDQGWSVNYQKAKLIKLSEYMETPPEKCLDAIIEARNTNLFEDFKLLHVVWTKETKKVPDPIVFGTFKDLDDYFFITQWDDDISLEDLLD
jgi:hypothetical protein